MKYFRHDVTIHVFEEAPCFVSADIWKAVDSFGVKWNASLSLLGLLWPEYSAQVGSRSIIAQKLPANSKIGNGVRRCLLSSQDFICKYRHCRIEISAWIYMFCSYTKIMPYYLKIDKIVSLCVTETVSRRKYFSSASPETYKTMKKLGARHFRSIRPPNNINTEFPNWPF